MGRPNPNSQKNRVEKILRDAINEGITEMEIVGEGLNYEYLPPLIRRISQKVWEEEFDKAYKENFSRFPKGPSYRKARSEYYRYISCQKHRYGGRQHVFVKINHTFIHDHMPIYLQEFKEEKAEMLKFHEDWNRRTI